MLFSQVANLSYPLPVGAPHRKVMLNAGGPRRTTSHRAAINCPSGKAIPLIDSACSCGNRTIPPLMTRTWGHWLSTAGCTSVRDRDITNHGWFSADMLRPNERLRRIGGADNKPTVSPAKNSLVYFISIAYIDHPVLRGHCQEAKRGEAGGHRITRNCEALGSFLLTCATTELSLLAMWCLSGATPRGQPWTPAVTLPHGRDGLSARRMASVVDVPRALSVSSRAPRFNAQRGAQFDPYNTRNCLPPKKLRREIQ